VDASPPNKRPRGGGRETRKLERMVGGKMVEKVCCDPKVTGEKGIWKNRNKTPCWGGCLRGNKNSVKQANKKKSN